MKSSATYTPKKKKVVCISLQVSCKEYYINGILEVTPIKTLNCWLSPILYSQGIKTPLSLAAHTDTEGVLQRQYETNRAVNSTIAATAQPDVVWKDKSPRLLKVGVEFWVTRCLRPVCILCESQCYWFLRWASKPWLRLDLENDCWFIARFWRGWMWAWYEPGSSAKGESGSSRNRQRSRRKPEP